MLDLNYAMQILSITFKSFYPTAVSTLKKKEKKNCPGPGLEPAPIKFEVHGLIHVDLDDRRSRPCPFEREGLAICKVGQTE